MADTLPDDPPPDLPLPPAVRDRLRLAPDESLRLLHAGPRTILLERVGSAPGPVLPRRARLVLSADVSALPLADVLHLVNASGRSGLLLFSFRDHLKSVYFHRGEVVFATSNVKVDRLGECLLRAGGISLEQLREAERRLAPPGRLGKVLVERGFLTPRELWQGVKDQVEEIVRSLFAYASGRVHLWEGEVQPDNVVRLSLPTGRLVAEGLERRDELFRFLAALEDPRVEIAREEELRDSLEGTERALFDALGSEPSFPGLCRRVELDALSAARTLQLLRRVGAVRIARARDARAYLSESDLHALDEEALRECTAGSVKRLAELAAPLVALDGAGAVRGRLAHVLRDLAPRHPELLEGVRLDRCATVDPDVLLERALALRGDRVAQVREALGELAAYLEFELKNHPRIADPEPFLSGSAALRPGSAT